MKNKNSFLVKFTIAAAMIGFFSPSVSVNPTATATDSVSMTLSGLHVSLFTQAEARRGGGVHRSGNRNINRNRNTNINRNRNTNINRNYNRNVNVNVNHRYYGGGHYGYYRGAPLLAFSTGLVIGSMVAASTMPSTCTTVVANGISYRRCSNTYYQPFYEGDTLVYKVVASPY